MKRNVPRTGSRNRSGPQDPHCTHRNLGRRRDGACSYGRRSKEVSSRPMASIMSSVIGGMLDLADRSIRRLSGNFKKSSLLGNNSDNSGATLAELELGREGLSRLQDNARKLPENHEESHLIADKQE